MSLTEWLLMGHRPPRPELERTIWAIACSGSISLKNLLQGYARQIVREHMMAWPLADLVEQPLQILGHSRSMARPLDTRAPELDQASIQEVQAMDEMYLQLRQAGGLLWHGGHRCV